MPGLLCSLPSCCALIPSLRLIQYSLTRVPCLPNNQSSDCRNAVNLVFSTSRAWKRELNSLFPVQSEAFTTEWWCMLLSCGQGSIWIIWCHMSQSPVTEEHIVELHNSTLVYAALMCHACCWSIIFPLALWSFQKIMFPLVVSHWVKWEYPAFSCDQPSACVLRLFARELWICTPLVCAFSWLDS
jgi:hypothetical protein